MEAGGAHWQVSPAVPLAVPQLPPEEAALRRQYFERGFVKSPAVPCTHMPLLSLLWNSPVSSCSIQLQRGLKDCPLYCLIEKPFHSLSKDKGQGEKGKDWFCLLCLRIKDKGQKRRGKDWFY